MDRGDLQVTVHQVKTEESEHARMQYPAIPLLGIYPEKA